MFLIPRVVAISNRRWSPLVPRLFPMQNTFLKISKKYGIISTLELPSKQNTLRNSFMRTRLVRNLQQTAHCTYNILCACGSRPLAVWLHEHRHILRHSPLEKSKLEHAFEDSHKARWEEAGVLKTESNSRCRKYKESTYMARLTNSISWPILEISLIWILCISSIVTFISFVGNDSVNMPQQ
jgi:hypothetical protein